MNVTIVDKNGIELIDYLWDYTNTQPSMEFVNRVKKRKHLNKLCKDDISKTSTHDDMLLDCMRYNRHDILSHIRIILRENNELSGFINKFTQDYISEFKPQYVRDFVFTKQVHRLTTGNTVSNILSSSVLSFFQFVKDMPRHSLSFEINHILSKIYHVMFTSPYLLGSSENDMFFVLDESMYDDFTDTEMSYHLPFTLRFDIDKDIQIELLSNVVRNRAAVALGDNSVIITQTHEDWYKTINHMSHSAHMTSLSVLIFQKLNQYDTRSGRTAKYKYNQSLINK